MPRSTPPPPETLAFPAGSLETLILRALEVEGALHGYGIARLIERQSGALFRIEEGSLYPALRRLEKRGDVVASWSESDTGRRARFYRVTAAGRRRLAVEKSAWSTLTAVMGSMLGVVAGAKPRAQGGAA